jgi:hypothetical protein
MVGSDTLVRAWLEGDWTVIEGAYFDCRRYEQHVVEPFEVPAHWARFRAMDWDSAKPFSVGWWAIVSDDHYVPRAKGGLLTPATSRRRVRAGVVASIESKSVAELEFISSPAPTEPRDCLDEPCVEHRLVSVEFCFRTIIGPPPHPLRLGR